MTEQRGDGGGVGAAGPERRVQLRQLRSELAPGGRARAEGAAAAHGPQDGHHHRGSRLQGWRGAGSRHEGDRRDGRR